MECGYPKLLYGQRNKNETIVSMIKRLFGEHIRSRLVRTQNRELSFRCIAYNTHRLTNLTLIIDAFYKATFGVNFHDSAFIAMSFTCVPVGRGGVGCLGITVTSKFASLIT